MNRLKRLAPVGVLGCLVLLLFGGCSSSKPETPGSSSPDSKANQERILSRYDLLKPIKGVDGAKSWRTAGTDWKKYDKVLIERIKVYIKEDSKEKGIDPTDLKMLTDYFYEALKKELTPIVQIVDKPGPDVLGVRIAIIDLKPTDAALSVAGTLIPYGFVAEAASGVASGRPAGSTPYLGECGIEVQFIDGSTGKIVAEFTDTIIGKKYDLETSGGGINAAKKWADGYFDSFTTWNYAKDAFNLWASLFKQRFNELRGMENSK